MSDELHQLYRADFLAFAGKAMRELEGTTLSDDRYLEVVADGLMKLHRGEIRRLLINMPPRHAKTFLASVCFAAWLLGHRPNAKILIETYADALAEAIARAVRSLMGAQFYRASFSTRLQKGHASATNFATTRGGEVRATTLHGSVTGFGADVIIVDDPHNATEAGYPKKLAATIEKFQTNVMTRLNNRNKGAVVVVAHRIHEQDLSANLISDGGWDHVVLPQIATRDETYRTAWGTWHRRKGTLLQPERDNFNDVERMRKALVNPSFDLLYQQDVDGQALPAVREDHFPFYSPDELCNARYVISIDPGTDEGATRSFSVVQVWADDGQDRFLIEQFRDQCDFYELGRMTKRFARRYPVTAILVEQTALGPALKSELTRKQIRRVEGVIPRGSKRARFRRHVESRPLISRIER